MSAACQGSVCQASQPLRMESKPTFSDPSCQARTSHPPRLVLNLTASSLPIPTAIPVNLSHLIIRRDIRHLSHAMLCPWVRSVARGRKLLHSDSSRLLKSASYDVREHGCCFEASPCLWDSMLWAWNVVAKICIPRLRHINLLSSTSPGAFMTSTDH